MYQNHLANATILQNFAIKSKYNFSLEKKNRDVTELATLFFLPNWE